MVIGRGGFQVFPDAKINPEDAIPVFQGQPAGGPQRSSATHTETWTQEMKEKGSSDEQFALHARNFVDCVKSRERPIADVEGGHRVTTTCHLANLSLRLGRKLRWDPEKEDFPGDAEASARLVRPYRKPWDKVLASFHL
jgi:hypothetical protein